MRKFFICHNNGVAAIVDECVRWDIEKYGAISSFFYKDDEEKEEPYEKRWRQTLANNTTFHLCLPTFTFTSEARYKDSPWFTGGDILLDALVRHIRDNGGIIQEDFFHVPFSNGYEIGMHGKPFMEAEMAYVTTRQQFFETFGVRMEDLLP